MQTRCHFIRARVLIVPLSTVAMRGDERMHKHTVEGDRGLSVLRPEDV